MSTGEQRIVDFCSQLAAGTPTPGGGAAAAVSGAMGAALVSMVAGLTAGREKYAAVNDEMLSLQAMGDRETQAMLQCADNDAVAFDQVMAALALPKATDEEKATRRDALQKGYQAATVSPLDTMKHAVVVMRGALAAASRGNTNALSDGYVGFLMANTAFEGALWNVAINLPSLKDEAFKEAILADVARLRNEQKEIAAAMLEMTPDPVQRFLKTK
ncbi:MAG TPA: cyclodeaminase/cyclohydrolase family protein [Symbiobacteriaceae bacterium]|nr:cyclodeaminase/cyclohydrolase family protein [Symbiobacteriaceae bacterium]